MKLEFYYYRMKDSISIFILHTLKKPHIMAHSIAHLEVGMIKSIYKLSTSIWWDHNPYDEIKFLTLITDGSWVIKNKLHGCILLTFWKKLMEAKIVIFIEIKMSKNLKFSMMSKLVFEYWTFGKFLRWMSLNALSYLFASDFKSLFKNFFLNFKK